MTHALTPQQLRDLEIVERTASCFSLLGTSFILFTFIYSPLFRRPVNRLVFYASWGNTLCNIATLISQTGVSAGKESHLCQFQGFLIQMFLPADALWNLAMAINVYLTLFKKYNAHQLKALEWRYHLICYGAPFIVALVYLFITTPDRGRIYGPATLWCWIDINWVVFRIATCYAPAWCCIIISFGIYLRAGLDIFTKRHQLRAFSSQTRAPVNTVLSVQNPFTSFKTTEIHITSELAPMTSPNMSNFYLSQAETQGEDYHRGGMLHVKQGSYGGKGAIPSRSPSGRGYDQYSVTIGSTPLSPSMEMPPVTLVKSGGVEKGKYSRNPANDANAAAWGYTKVALLFFVSLLVTWVPSSINRVYSLVHPDLVSLPFTYAAGIVLPLMGFWNSVIYITTSWPAVRGLFMSDGPYGRGSRRRASAAFNHGRRQSIGSRGRVESDTDSVKQLHPEGDREQV